MLCLYCKKKETFCFVIGLFKTFAGRFLIHRCQTSDSILFWKDVSPLVCVAAGTKKKGIKLVGDKFVAPPTNCAFITRDFS